MRTICLIFISSMCLFAGCERQDTLGVDTALKGNVDNRVYNEKLFKFISVAFNVEVEDVSYDEKRDSIIINGVGKVEFNEASNFYKNANEYKLKYEKD